LGWTDAATYQVRVKVHPLAAFLILKPAGKLRWSTMAERIWQEEGAQTFQRHKKCRRRLESDSKVSA
jgi:hypothetical protein